MALYKVIAGYLDEKQNWIEQKQIAMGPLEEAAVRADWAMGSNEATKPQDLTASQKVDMLTDPLKGTLAVTASTALYVSQKQTYESKSAALDADRIAKWNAFNEQMSKLPAGTKTC